MRNQLYPTLSSYVESVLAKIDRISPERLSILEEIVRYVIQREQAGSLPELVFICTHNSRRSHLAQIWAATAAYYYGINCRTYSGGTEATAFNTSAVKAISTAGFKVSVSGKHNPVYTLEMNEGQQLNVFSKVFDDDTNPSSNFAAVMTCAEADENCPFIPGADLRIPLRYEDPKAFDGTPEEQLKYEQRSFQIATEMFYVFSKVN